MLKGVKKYVLVAISNAKCVIFFSFLGNKCVYIPLIFLDFFL